MHGINNNYHHNHHHNDNNIYVKNINEQVLKHVESLRTRLGFAQFKLSNGWENNTLGDVECFWKQKQRQSIKDIPIPRFTQQDIIDKRSYIQASGVKYAKARRYRLLSNPSLNSNNNKSIIKSRRKSHPLNNQQHQYISEEDEEGNDSSSTVSSTKSKRQQQNQTYYFHHYDNETYKKAPIKPTPIHSVSSFDASCVPNDLNGEPSVVKNSLDYLSYAIAMTEKNNQNSDIMEEPALLEDADTEDNDLNFKEDWRKTSQLRLSLSIPNSNNSPSPTTASPTNLAAQAMLMFVNRD